MKQYKCPLCGGYVEFDSNLQKLKCPYCETEFDVDALNQADETMNIVSADDKMDNWDTAKNDELGIPADARLYLCESCGGEIIGDANLGATVCPYCGNNVVIKEQFANSFRPDLIIPFKLDKKAAKEALARHLKGKKLLPKVFTKENHLDEIKGIYVPFWLYNAKVEGGVKYKATTERSWTSGEYIYTETKYYDVFREGSIAFHDIPVDASSKMPDDLMDSLEPFDLKDAVDFNTAYFAGYLADKYDVTVEENIPRINLRVKNSTEESFKNTVKEKYDTISVENSVINLKEGNAKYSLLPVWILNTSWRGNNYLFAMNGQTGKFVGDLPMDKKLYWKYWFLAFLISAPLTVAAGYLLKYILKHFL